jgi:alanine racemase
VFPGFCVDGLVYRCFFYADGLHRSFGYGNGVAFIQGQFVPFVGSICMDMCMVDVTDLDVQEGDEVEIFGPNNSIKEMADRGRTIPYEILTSISSRVNRVFVGEY